VSVSETAFTFRGLPSAGHYGAAGTSAVRIAGQARSLVQIFARKQRLVDLSAALRGAYGFDLPPPGHAATGGEIVALWIGRDSWLLATPRGAEGALANAVKSACGNAGSVVDQTHGYGVLRLSGAFAPHVLARLCRIDLHSRVFGPGQVAVTPIADLSCTLHQIDTMPSYDLIFPTTFAEYFVTSLTQAAAAVGYDIA
jgi:heterotetrameric sarcosine oxidase gamma subunit